MSDKSFEKNIVNTSHPLITRNREYQFNQQQNYELNTYASWGETDNAVDTMENYGVDDKGKPIVFGDSKSKAGIKSIFNKYAFVIKSDDIRISNNVPLIDTPENRKSIKKNSDCSIKNLVNCSKQGILGSATYDYSDFAYCKHLGKMPNNYMITLRRFPIPVSDFIKPTGYNSDNIFPNSLFGDPNSDGSYVPPVSMGCLVTWLGTPGNEMENILKYDYNMSYKPLESKYDMESIRRSEGGGVLNAISALFDPNYQQAVEKGQAGSTIAPLAGNLFGGHVKQGLENPRYADHLTFRDQNKVYGPIDRIQDTHIRSDEGLKFNHSFSLTFEYELRAYNNINTRQAMLDLLANVLAVTYQAGDFFPGAYRAMGTPQSDVFTNLRVMQASGGVSAFKEGFMEDASNITGKIKGFFEENGGFIGTVKKLGDTFGGMILGGLLNKLGRPQREMLNSLLSPAPVGLWHVTVGNPFHPIMTIGNMILEKTTITHTGPLGLDDFPTGLKVVCELKRAKGRDKRDIEKLYMHGINRIYTHVNTDVDQIFNAAPEYKHDKEMDEYRRKMKAKIESNSIEAVDSSLLDMIATDIPFEQNDIKVRYFGTNYIPAITLASGEISYGSQPKQNPENTSTNQS